MPAGAREAVQRPPAHRSATALGDCVAPGGPLRKGHAQVAPRIAVKTALTAKALPWSEDCQGHHLAPPEGDRRPRVSLKRQGGLAKIIDHDIKSRGEGIGRESCLCEVRLIARDFCASICRPVQFTYASSSYMLGNSTRIPLCGVPRGAAAGGCR